MASDVTRTKKILISNLNRKFAKQAIRISNISHKILKTKPSGLKIVRRFYFYAPIWYPISSLKETGIICFELSHLSRFLKD